MILHTTAVYWFLPQYTAFLHAVDLEIDLGISLQNCHGTPDMFPRILWKTFRSVEMEQAT